MISHELREFVDRVLDSRTVCDDDVRFLQRDILPTLVAGRDDVDVLLALDRAVAVKSPLWADMLTAFVVDFAVWQNRPTGIVGRDKAHWLATTLAAGEGATPLAGHIAFEIVREAESCDELLIAFALRRRVEPLIPACDSGRLLLAS